MSNQTQEITQAIDNIPTDVPDELRLEILKELMKTKIPDHPVTIASHKEWFDMFVEAAKFMGPSAQQVSKYYFANTVCQLELPSFFSCDKFVIPSCAPHIRNLKLIIPIEIIDKGDDSFGPLPECLTLSHGSILQYIFRRRVTAPPYVPRLGLIHTLYNFPTEPPAIIPEWIDRLTSLETLELVFEHRVSPGHYGILELWPTLFELLDWPLELPHYLELAHPVPEVTVTVIAKYKTGHRRDEADQFARVMCAIIAQDFSGLDDVITDVLF